MRWYSIYYYILLLESKYKAIIVKYSLSVRNLIHNTQTSGDLVWNDCKKNLFEPCTRNFMYKLGWQFSIEFKFDKTSKCLDCAKTKQVMWWRNRMMILVMLKCQWCWEFAFWLIGRYDYIGDLPMVMIVCCAADGNAGGGEEAGEEEEEVEGGGRSATSDQDGKLSILNWHWHLHLHHGF